MNKPQRYCLVVLGFLISALFTTGAQAQFYTGSNMSFGRKRVQYETFFWSYYRFNKFDTYFNRNGRNLALYTSSYVQNYLGDIEIRVGQPLNDKLQFIIFNRLTDYKQSNIGYTEEENYNVGGVTKILGTKVFLYFNGDYVDFERQIRSGITEILVNQSLYGSSVGAQMKSEIMMALPDWFSTGLVAYLSDSWRTEYDNIIRDAALTQRFKYIGALEGEDAKIAGHSFFEFIGRRYGHAAVLRLLGQVRNSRRIDQVFQHVLGKKYKPILKEWQEFWTDATGFQADSLDLKQTLSKIKTPDRTYYQYRISPDGTHLAYISNELGKARLYVRDRSKRRPRKIYQVGYALNDNPDYSYPCLTWHPDGEMLLFVAERKGLTQLVYYNLKTKKSDWILLENIDKVLSIAYAPDGRKVVMSAIQNGQSDIYIHNMMTNTTTALTKDIYDDMDPRFFNDKVLFSSNRPDEVLKRQQRFPHAPKLVAEHAVFMLDPAKPHEPLMRVSDSTDRHSSMPIPLRGHTFSFLSDANGITNARLAWLDSAVVAVDTAIHYRHFTHKLPASNYNTSILEQDYDPLSGQWAPLMFYQKKYRLAVLPEELSPLPDTLSWTPFRMSEGAAARVKVSDSLSEEQAPDSLSQASPIASPNAVKRMRQSTTDDMVEDLVSLTLEAAFKDTIVDDTIRSQLRDQIEKRITHLLGLNASISPDSLPKGTITPKQRVYQVEYKINETTTQLSMSFLNASYQAFSGGGSPIYLNPSVSGFLKIGASDLMENHRIVAGYSFSFDFQSNEYLLSYENLERRLGKQYAFHRQSIGQSGNGYRLKQITHNAYYILKYPFNEVTLLKGTVFGRTDKIFWKSTDDQTLKEPAQWRFWAGLKGELIFDHTRNLAKNIQLGYRSKIFAEYYQSLTEKKSMMFVLGADYRNYTRIWRTFIWANRIAGSTSFGPSKLIYYMGSVDGELLPKFNRNIVVDPTQNYAYQTLATNMRGFTQNIRNGNSFVVINSEVRFPIVSCLSRNPPKASWLRNLQAIVFGDVGTAWVGWNPWSKDNALYREQIQQGDLTITLEKDLSPIVGSLGLGLRTEIFGYFIRVDYGFGIENGQFNKGAWHFSLGLDF